MKRFFDTELDAFRSHLIQMGEKSIEQVRGAIRALVDADVELARGTDDGIYRAGLDALGTADALGLANEGHHGRFFTFGSVQGLGFHVEQVGQRLDGRFAAGWAGVSLASSNSSASRRPAARSAWASACSRRWRSWLARAWALAKSLRNVSKVRVSLAHRACSPW